MPVNKSFMDKLQKEYGKDKGESIYYALENKMKKHSLQNRIMKSK